jgi:hypothetical protein
MAAYWEAVPVDHCVEPGALADRLVVQKPPWVPSSSAILQTVSVAHGVLS